MAELRPDDQKAYMKGYSVTLPEADRRRTCKAQQVSVDNPGTISERLQLVRNFD